jgi:hypothetical protein
MIHMIQELSGQTLRRVRTIRGAVFKTDQIGAVDGIPGRRYFFLADPRVAFARARLAAPLRFTAGFGAATFGTACFAAARLGAASFGVWPTFARDDVFRTADFVLDLRELSSAAATIGRFFTSATAACSSVTPRTWGTVRSSDSLM